MPEAITRDIDESFCSVIYQLNPHVMFVVVVVLILQCVHQAIHDRNISKFSILAVVACVFSRNAVTLCHTQYVGAHS